MSSNKDWKKFKIGDEIELQYGKGLPKKKRKKGSYPVYGSSGITGYHNDYYVEGPGVIIGRKGTIGKVYMCKNNFWPIDTTYYLQFKNDNNDLKFWNYYLKYLPLKDMNSHSAVPGLNREQVYNLDGFIPPLKEQKAIANILSTLDEKIKLNNQMNQTLEEIAQAIYKNWFVDFGPWQDEEFVDSELGKIPKGWKQTNISEIINLTLGNSPKSDTYNEEENGLPLLNGASDFENGHPSTTRFSSDPKRVANKGEIILCTRGTIGNVSFTDKKYCIGRGVSSMKAKSEKFKDYIYFTVKNHIYRLTQQAAGSVIKGLTKADMLNIPIVKPPEKIMKKFHRIVKPIFKKKKNNYNENKKLKQIRDNLLPKLMSGEIRVEPDAKEKVGG